MDRVRRIVSWWIAVAALCAAVVFVVRPALDGREQMDSPDQIPDRTDEGIGPVHASDAPAPRARVEEPPAPSAQPRSVERKKRKTQAPLEVLLHAVDTAGASVADATVEVWEGEDDQQLTSVSTLRTDASGLCMLTLPQTVPRVMVSKPGVGTTGELSPIKEQLRALRSEWIVTLNPFLRLVGVVLRSDGSPATTASVFARRDWPRYPGDRPLAPLAADGEGRFAVDLATPATYVVSASEGNQTTQEVTFTAWQPATKELTLRMRGGFYLRGFLLDPAGRPVAGNVTVRGKPPIRKPGAFPVERLFSEKKSASREGSFEVDLPGPGLYQVVGSASAHAHSEMLEIAVTQERPHADLVLRLLTWSTIHGTVVTAHGGPIADAGLMAHPEKAEPEPTDMYGYSPSLDQFGSVAAAGSSEDGAFQLNGVHPGTTWRLTCNAKRNGSWLSAEMRGVHPVSAAVSFRWYPAASLPEV